MTMVATLCRVEMPVTTGPGAGCSHITSLHTPLPPLVTPADTIAILNLRLRLLPPRNCRGGGDL